MMAISWNRIYGPALVARGRDGAAIVGDPDQVLAKINRYRDMGIEAFILSGYPHKDECDLFARYVLPEINRHRLRWTGDYG